MFASADEAVNYVQMFLVCLEFGCFLFCFVLVFFWGGGWGFFGFVFCCFFCVLFGLVWAFFVLFCFVLENNEMAC